MKLLIATYSLVLLAINCLGPKPDSASTVKPHVLITHIGKQNPDAIKQYILYIDNLKRKNKLIRKFYPDMSLCGGALSGYYYNNKLVYIESVYGAEMGSETFKNFYLNDTGFIAVNYGEHLAELGIYEKKYPPESYPFDASKMTYTDVLYQYELGAQPFCIKTEKGKPEAVKINHVLLQELLKCGKSMKEELESIH